MFNNPEKKKPPSPPELHVVELDDGAWLDPESFTWVGKEIIARRGRVTVLITISPTPVNSSPGRSG